MKVERLLNLISLTAEGKDNIKKGAVGFASYGFVFRDTVRGRYYDPLEPYMTIQGSSKVCSIGLLLGHNPFQQDLEGGSWKAFLRYAEEEDIHDLLLAGSLKTLIPTLRFGGDELLFHVWMFIKTPDGKQFPATFYYRQSGLSLGGWKSNKDSSGNVVFSEEFLSIVNFNPFEFKREELEDLVQAIEHALGKVPVSNFHGVFEHDFGQTLIGIHRGKPFSVELRRPMNEQEINELIRHRVF